MHYYRGLDVSMTSRCHYTYSWIKTAFTSSVMTLPPGTVFNNNYCLMKNRYLMQSAILLNKPLLTWILSIFHQLKLPKRSISMSSAACQYISISCHVPKRSMSVYHKGQDHLVEIVSVKLGRHPRYRPLLQ